MPSPTAQDTARGLASRATLDAVLASRPCEHHPAAAPDFLVLSLDQFPTISTEYGKTIAEQAITLAARFVADALRPGDLGARYDEHRFTIVLAERSTASIEAMVARVRDSLAKANEKGSLPTALTVSAAWTRGAQSVEASVLRAKAPATSQAAEPTAPAPTIAVPKAQDVILIVDDEAGLLALTREILSTTGATILCARGAQEGLAYLTSRQVDVVVADIHLPDINGLELLKQIRLADPGVVVIMVTGSRDLSLAIRAIRTGADDYLIKPFSPHDLRDSVSRGLTKRQLILGGKAYQAMLESQVHQRTREFAQVIRHLEATYQATLKALGAALDTRDVETHAHSERVARYALTLGRLVQMHETDLITLERGVYLHDIGKIGIPDRVLLKQGNLTEEEWEVMRRHSQLGFRLASRIDFLKGASKIILTHHERYDGSGYPYGLKGDAIPFGARIFAVVDTLDAMTSDRPYRKALSFGSAREEISRCIGKQFDPQVVEAFLSVPEATWSDIREAVNQQALEQVDVSEQALLAEGRSFLF